MDGMAPRSSGTHKYDIVDDGIPPCGSGRGVSCVPASRTPPFPTASKPSAFCTPFSPLLSSNKTSDLVFPDAGTLSSRRHRRFRIAATHLDIVHSQLRVPFHYRSPRVSQGAVLRVIEWLGPGDRNTVLVYTTAWSSFPSDKM